MLLLALRGAVGEGETEEGEGEDADGEADEDHGTRRWVRRLLICGQNG